MCAAGPFIPDHLYDKSMEGQAWSDIKNHSEELSTSYTEDQHELIASLQAVHDYQEVSDWPAHLNKLWIDIEAGLYGPID